MAKKPTPPPGLTPEEDLRADNELAALGLEMKYGAITHIEGDAPPELIQQFLANVAAFEEQKNDRKTTVFKLIGEPKFATPDLLEPETLPGELARIQDILEENGFVVLGPENIDKADFYQFLVDEIFPYEVPEMRPPGMVTVLDYAEFHPDFQLVIAQVASQFLLDLLNIDHLFLGEMLDEICRTDTGKITRERAMQTIENFRKSYKKVTPLSFRPESLEQPGHGTYLMFGVRWEGISAKTGEKEQHEGLGVMQFVEKNGMWLVQGVNMPGFKF